MPTETSVPPGPDVGSSTRTRPGNSLRSWGVSVLSDVLDRAGLGEPASSMLVWLEGGAVACVDRCRRFDNSLCPICLDSTPTTFGSSDCDHTMCTRCAIEYLRSALGDAQVYITAAGVRCPLHSSGCDAFITAMDASLLLTERDLKRFNTMAHRYDAMRGTKTSNRPWLVPPAMVAWSEQRMDRMRSAIASRMVAHFGPSNQRLGSALGIEEVQKLQTFMIKSAIPEEERICCPRCKLIVLLPEPKSTSSTRERRSLRLRSMSRSTSEDVMHFALRALGRAPSQRPPVQAPFCCPHCLHTWDPLRDVPDPRAGAGDASFDEFASRMFIKLTSKACPRCTHRITHWHGQCVPSQSTRLHVCPLTLTWFPEAPSPDWCALISVRDRGSACHHISPQTNGCPNCHQHFCYQCMRKHGAPESGYRRNRFCPHGSSFCKNQDILDYLVMDPYPHDRRCGCPICSQCARGRPCAQCDGTCVVCTGIVAPGPTSLSAASLANAERSSSIVQRKASSIWRKFCSPRS